jgi:hypothetical protein
MLHAWSDIQKWKRIKSTSVEFSKEAEKIFDKYLHLPPLHQLLEKISALKAPKVPKVVEEVMVINEWGEKVPASSIKGAGKNKNAIKKSKSSVGNAAGAGSGSGKVVLGAGGRGRGRGDRGGGRDGRGRGRGRGGRAVVEEVVELELVGELEDDESESDVSSALPDETEAEKEERLERGRVRRTAREKREAAWEEEKNAMKLKEVLVKYGLGADLETLWGMVFSTHDIAWMSAEEMGGDAK